MSTEQPDSGAQDVPGPDDRYQVVEILGVIVTVDELEEALTAIGAYPPASPDASSEND